MLIRLLLLLSVCCLCATSVSAEDAATVWKAGSAAVKITPDGPMWMAGYASRDKPSDGVAQDLFAKALVLQDGAGVTAVIVTLDLISVPSSLRTQVSQQLAQDYRWPDSALLMNCSHTHCGPEIRASSEFPDDVPTERQLAATAYAKQLQERILQAIKSAQQQLAPAKISYQRARAGFAMNRRRPVDGKYQNAPYPAGPVDHDVPVLRVDDVDGKKLRAVLFGYACHNTTLGFSQICGDYAGFAQDALQAAHPETVAMFMLGCGGDQNPYPRRTIELARQHGQTLATAVEAALETPPRVLSGSLVTAIGTAEVEYAPAPSLIELQARSKAGDAYDRHWAERMLKRLDQGGQLPKKYDAPVQVLRLGNEVLLVALPGETVVDYSLRLKSELSRPNGPSVWVAGYSNDVFAYVPSRRVLLEGGYEAGEAMKYFTSILHPGPFAPNVEERLVGRVHELVRDVDATTRK